MSLIDIHCHPSLKIFLFHQHLSKKADPMNLNITTKMLVNLPDMQQGGVNAAISVHYLPEHNLIVDVKKRKIFKIIVDIAEEAFGGFIEGKFEDMSSPTAPYEQIKKMMSMLEKDVEEANNDASGKFKTRVAKSYSEFINAIDNGETVFIHSLEGAHCLGHHIDYATCEKEIIELFDAGVCQFTLAHFFENILVSSQGGIPPKITKTIAYDPANTYPNGYNEEDNLTERLVSKMLDLGIIIDLVHCTPGAKKMVYRVNDSRGNKKRPLVFSHTGLREVAQKYKPDMPQSDLDYLPNRDDVLRIKDCDGVLGIIFMDYWLNGDEDNGNGIDVVIETIKEIKNICGDYNHIAIGSDLDGFTEVPKDLKGIEYMPRLIDEMERQGISKEDYLKICFNNYKRVLQNGWGKQ
ncbi:MAG TPA: membrane dipeptidase [Chitinophagales bacterium]|nr:membrane dipeptidase [Chitinophagales bacterium]